MSQKEQEDEGGGWGVGFKQYSTSRRINGFFAAVTIKHLQGQKFQISVLSVQIIAGCSYLLCGMTRPTCVRAVMLCVLIDIDLVEVSGTMQRSYFSLIQLFL